jgi:hypothetical protein
VSAKDEYPRRGREIPRRTALFGVNREYTDALEQGLTRARQHLAAAKATNEQMSNDLACARAALAHATGWSERLPAAVRVLARLAAGDLDEHDPDSPIAAAIMTLIGEELLASVDISTGDPEGAPRRDTTLNENARPIATTVRIGGCVVECTWQPGANASRDTAEIVEGLCEAVVCSLAAATAARAKRDVVTQLADERSLRRHQALRERTGRPGSLVRVTVDGKSAVEHRELYGRLAWSAALADAATALEHIANANGGQAYHLSDRDFRLLVDPDNAEHACEQTERALADQDPLIFNVTLIDQ